MADYPASPSLSSVGSSLNSSPPPSPPADPFASPPSGGSFEAEFEEVGRDGNFEEGGFDEEEEVEATPPPSFPSPSSQASGNSQGSPASPPPAAAASPNPSASPPLPPPPSSSSASASASSSPPLRSIGGLGVWTLTTAKPGNGIHQLQDNSPDTYWQSDGASPHTISVSFARKQTFSKVMIYLDYTLDESYTPKKLAVGVGMCRDDLAGAQTEVVEFTEPNGWVEVWLGEVTEEAVEGEEEEVEEEEEEGGEKKKV